MKTLFAAALLLLSAHSFAWRDALPQAQLVGEGELRWFGLSIYNAKLWSPQPAQVIASNGARAPFALELTYNRSISRDRFVDTSADEIRRLYGDRVSAAQMENWRAEMQRAFVDVEAGTRITGVYLPGEGCRFYVNDRLQHTVRDMAFADAFFAIWLDPRSKDAKLRRNLLAKATT